MQDLLAISRASISIRLLTGRPSTDSDLQLGGGGAAQAHHRWAGLITQRRKSEKYLLLCTQRRLWPAARSALVAEALLRRTIDGRGSSNSGESQRSTCSCVKSEKYLPLWRLPARLLRRPPATMRLPQICQLSVRCTPAMLRCRTCCDRGVTSGAHTACTPAI